MPRDRDQHRYITFRNEPSSASATEVVSIHHSFKLMDTAQHTARTRAAILNATPSKSRWHRVASATRRALCVSSKKTTHLADAGACSYPSISSGRGHRSSFWCCCWCGSTPSFNAAASSDMAISSRYRAASPAVGEATYAAAVPPRFGVATTSPVVHGAQRTTSAKYWNGDDSFRSNADRFLQTLEQDMEAERSLRRGRGNRPLKVSLLFRGILRVGRREIGARGELRRGYGENFGLQFSARAQVVFVGL